MNTASRLALHFFLLSMFSSEAFAQPSPTHHSMHLFAQLDATCTALSKDFGNISSERKQQLRRIAEYIRQTGSEQKSDSKKVVSSKKATVRLTFICTHNSRRSHIAQLWAKAAAEWYGVKNIETYSGGTETTAFNPRAVAAMRRVGFRMESDTSSASPQNPHYTVHLSEHCRVEHIFSKRFDDASNPHEHFAAVMVCSHAEEHCPFVPGAERRFSLPYNDPKDFDGTPEETSMYDARVREIGRDMLWLMQEIAKK